jgi:lipoprotein-anchoring transpeptidase ErfK/SrfK
MRANGLSSPDRIFIGQRLRIAGQPAQSAPPSGSPPTTPLTAQTPVEAAPRALLAGDKVSASPVDLATSNDLLPETVIRALDRQPSRGAPQPAESTPHRRWISVDLSDQRLVAYEGDRAVRSTLVSTGRSYTPTPIGRFAIRNKIAYQTMVGPGYYLPRVPHVMYFVGGNALHGAYWHNNFGTPMSHGCVNLPLDEAAWLFQWASVGSLVVVQP